MELTGNVSGLINLGGGGGSTVEVTPILTSGEHIADIEVDGVTSELYAPEPTAPTEVEVTPVVTSGTKIATIGVDGDDVDLYAPTPTAPTEVEVTPVVTSGTKIATIGVDGDNVDLYAPSGGGVVNYSTTETLTGEKWIDDRDVYQIVVDLGSDTAVGTRSFVPTSYVMSYVDIYLSAWGIRSSNRYCYSLDATNNLDAQKHLALGSSQNASVRYVILKYVKSI